MWIPVRSVALLSLALAWESPIEQGGSMEDAVDYLKETLASAELLSSRSREDSVAIAREWIRLRNAAGDDQPLGKRVDFFWGYLSGRLKLTPPDWWNEEFRKGGISEKGTAWFTGRRAMRRWKGNSSGWKFSGLKAIDRREGELLLDFADRTVTLNESMLSDAVDEEQDWTINQADAVAASIANNECVVAFNCPTDVGGP